MNLSELAVAELTIARDRFNRSTRNLTEDMSGFVPAGEAMSTAQQVAHVARVIDWFMEGAFRREGFDMDFGPQIRQVLAISSLQAAREWLESSFTGAIRILTPLSDEDLLTLLPAGAVLNCMPRFAMIREMTDHTAHHRGALTVYARLNHVTPPDPYEA